MISRLLTAINVPISLTRADFPLTPDPTAQAKEARFRTEIYSLAQKGLGAGALGGGAGMFVGGTLRGGGEILSLQQQRQNVPANETGGNKYPQWKFGTRNGSMGFRRWCGMLEETISWYVRSWWVGILTSYRWRAVPH